MVDETFTNVTGGYKNFVMLELSRRGSGDTPGDDFETNRIGLLVNTMSIQTNKQSLAFPIPFSGIVSGESLTLAMDLGLATKTISLQGVILDQYIKKQNKHGSAVSVNMTAHEVAQLIHSYADSSFLHEDQNLSKMIILIPSRVDENFEQREGHETTEHRLLPLIPFNWANRDYDIPVTAGGYKLSLGGTDFPNEISRVVDSVVEKEIPGIPGFINDFSTDFAGEQYPQVTFSLTFTNASTAASDFINASF